MLKVVGYYDLSVLSMSVMGFQKKKVWIHGGWVGGWGELYPSLFWIFGICLTLQSPYGRCALTQYQVGHLMYYVVPNSCAVRNNSVGWKIHPN